MPERIHPASTEFRAREARERARIASRRRSMALLFWAALLVFAVALLMVLWPGAVLLLFSAIVLGVASLS